MNSRPTTARSSTGHAGTPRIDPDRIALWGSSFSGGHVIKVAAADPRIATVVSQAPFTDSVVAIRRMPLRNVVRGSLAAIRDRARALLGRAPAYLPAVGEPGSFAVMTEACASCR